MAARQQKPQGQVHVRGKQRELLEADLMAQLVIVLGRQLSQETMTDAVTGASTTRRVEEGRP